MRFGIFAGIFWALETIVLGIALEMTPFVSGPQAVFLAPFVSTFLHDLCSALWAILYNFGKGNLKKVSHILFETRSGIFVALGAIIGGPVGMSGYVLAIQYMGASMSAVASAIFPAIGSILAWIFLKERIRWYQWIFLCFTLLGVYGLGYSSDIQISNFYIGILGVLMCSFGWGSEAVILAKTLKNAQVKDEYILPIRQACSALFYGCVILPIIHGWSFTLSLFQNWNVVLWIGLAALFATISYLFYYRAIGKIGASKAMALNVSYAAWTLIFSVVLLGKTELLNPMTIVCTLLVLICGILSASDFHSLLE